MTRQAGGSARLGHEWNGVGAATARMHVQKQTMVGLLRAEDGVLIVLRASKGGPFARIMSLVMHYNAGFDAADVVVRIPIADSISSAACSDTCFVFVAHLEQSHRPRWL